jgi:catechol 2,3-dioxygenase-like lactoylglutathione lyase family enzyme
MPGFDHVAIPTDRPEALIEFYGRLGFVVPDAGEWQRSKLPFFSLFCGDQKINFHAPAMWRNPEFQLRGPSSVPGCGDLCFVWEGGMDALEGMLEGAGAAVVAGPLELHGARGRGRSVYIRDPDANLLEFIVYDEP